MVLATLMLASNANQNNPVNKMNVTFQTILQSRHQWNDHQNVCSECGQNSVISDPTNGELICSTCGLVVKETVLNRTPEWRAFTLAEKQSHARVGAPTSMALFDKGLSTTFQPSKDAQGRYFSSTKRLKMLRLRRWNYRAQRYTSVHRNLTQAMNAVTWLAEALHIPRAVIDTAAVFYRKALSLDLVKGRSIQSIAAASLYLACRLSQTPRSLKQVADVSPRSRKEIARCYRLLLRELRIHIPVDRPKKYVPEIASKVGLNQQTQNEADAILTYANKQFAVTGKAPKGMAAAALYIASIMTKQKVTQRDIAKASGVTEVTVRNRYKQLKHDLKISVNPR